MIFERRTEIHAAIFDFDYTLADSSEGCVECVNFAFQEMGLDRHSNEKICRTIGLSLKETFLTLSGDRDAVRVTSSEGCSCSEPIRLWSISP
jgi:phosphoglycolate phosphatase